VSPAGHYCWELVVSRDLKRARLREPWASARTRQRKREFAATFDRVPTHLFGAGLELGGGDGFVASLLAPYCRSFVTTDSYRPRLVHDACAVKRLVCDATALPFADASFDFIFSSSVLEHIRDLSAALSEMRRCLRPGGLMLHIMPSRTWKLLQLLFYYPHLVIAGVDALLDHIHHARRDCPASAARLPTTDRWSDERRWRLSLETVLRGAVPRVHGEYANHLSEWSHFGAAAWTREFLRHGLTVHKTLRLPLYSGYGFGLDRLRRLGEWLGLSAHNAFLVSDALEPPFALDWFRWSTCRPGRQGL
jgi:SAM-dependent methyltransferase